MVLTYNGNDICIKTAEEATNEALSYISDRKEGKIISLKSRWSNFNNLCSIDPNSLFTISGISGSGKSSFVNTLETDLIDLNPTQDIVVLSFTLEMLSSRQIGRKLSTRLRKTTRNLYSTDSSLTDSEYSKVKVEAESIKKYPIYYIEGPITIKAVESVISNFQKTVAKDKWLVITFDHTLLVDGDGSDKTNIDALQKVFMKAKKVDKTTIIQIAQLNRTLEAIDRIKNPSMHFPMRSDLSTSDFMYQCSDYVAVIHRPETLGIQSYGTQHLPVENMLYFHLLKNREGDVGILPFVNDLKYNIINEYKKPDSINT